MDNGIAMKMTVRQFLDYLGKRVPMHSSGYSTYIKIRDTKLEDLDDIQQFNKILVSMENYDD